MCVVCDSPSYCLSLHRHSLVNVCSHFKGLHPHTTRLLYMTNSIPLYPSPFSLYSFLLATINIFSSRIVTIASSSLSSFNLTHQREEDEEERGASAQLLSSNQAPPSFILLSYHHPLSFFICFGLYHRYSPFVFFPFTF